MQSMGLILLVTWIGVCNLVLGFALATAMGHGPRRMPQLKWKFIPRLRLPSFRVRLPSFRKRSAETPPETEPSADQPFASDAPSVDAPIIDTPAMDVPTETTTAVSEASNTEASNTAESDAAATSLARQTTADDDGLPLDMVLAQFQQEVAGVRDGLANVNQRVQECSESPTVEAVEECVADLKVVGNRLLDQQTDSLRAMDNCRGDSANSEQLISDMHEEAATQASHIRQTLDEIERMEVQQDSVDADCQRLKEHTDALTASCEAMDKSVSQAREQAGSEDTTTAEDDQRSDAAMEHMDASEALDHWWADDPEHQRPLTMAMIDIDGVGKLNETHGNEQVDALLREAKSLLLATDLSGGSATEIDAQRFLLLLPNGASEQSTQLVEQLRAAIHEIVVDPDDAQMHLTASCAVAKARAGDTAQALVTRAEAALAEAKQFGGNRTFLNEGDFPTPVVGNGTREPVAAT